MESALAAGTNLVGWRFTPLKVHYRIRPRRSPIVYRNEIRKRLRERQVEEPRLQILLFYAHVFPHSRTKKPFSPLLYSH